MMVITFRAKTFRFLELFGLAAIIGGIVAGTFFFGGFFSVAANHPDPEIINWMLIHVRKASIARHATDRPPGSLDDPALVRAGALAYSQNGCINCHGGPGMEPAKFSEGLNPAPNLKRVVNDLLPQELFWIIKNGIKMTGMPAWSDHSDEEIWATVTFLQKLGNGMTEPQYGELIRASMTHSMPAGGHHR